MTGSDTVLNDKPHTMIFVKQSSKLGSGLALRHSKIAMQDLAATCGFRTSPVEY